MKAYRRRLVGLPLQRSLFAGIHRAPELIGLRGVLPGDALSAWLDDEGDLYLDETHVATLAHAIPALATPGFLADMQRALADGCNAVVEATECARQRAPAASPEEAIALLSRLGEQVAALMPFGVLSKFVPDALYGVWERERSADEPMIPVPARSPGGDLTRAMAALCIAVQREGYAHGRLLEEWPSVSKPVAAMVRDFCRTHAGFGPLAWEETGYEDPEFVCRLLVAMFSEEDPVALLRRIEPVEGAARRDSPSGSALGTWLDFLERETWYVRRAFHVGFAPLLQRILPSCQHVDPRLTPSDLLFLTLPELVRQNFAPGSAAARRATYAAATEYLAQHGISDGRLRVLMGEA